MKNSRRAIIISVGIMAMVAFSFYWYLATEEETGEVDHKSICGVMDDTSYTLVVFTPYGLSVSPLVSDMFVDADSNLTVTAELEQELVNMGYDIYYIGNIKMTSSDDVNGIESGTTFGYFVGSRIDFNNLVLGTEVTFSVPHDEEYTIFNVSN